MTFNGVYIIKQKVYTIEEIYTYIQKIWPDCILELSPTRPIHECVIYETETYQHSWDDQGLTGDNQDSVVYIQIENNQTVFLVGSKVSDVGLFLV